MTIIAGKYVAANTTRMIPRVLAALLFFLIVLISSTLKCSVCVLCWRRVSEKMYKYIITIKTMQIKPTVVSVENDTLL